MYNYRFLVELFSDRAARSKPGISTPLRAKMNVENGAPGALEDPNAQ
jgi:hypothetical protein